MLAPIVFTFAGLIFAGLVFAGIVEHSRHRRFQAAMNERLTGRTNLSLEKMVAEDRLLSSCDAELVIQMWSDLAQCLRLPAERMRPGDAVSSYVVHSGYWLRVEMNAEDLLARWCRRIGTHRSQLPRLETLGETLQFFARSREPCQR